MTSNNDQLDGIAASYHTNAEIPDIHIENLCQEYFIDWLLPQIPRDARVLELGYGDGLVTAALVRSSCALTVVEGSGMLVERARSVHPELDCVHSLFEAFRPAAPYDFIIASHILEHVDDPQQVLRQLTGWLREQGKVMVAVPNRSSVHRQLAVIMGIQPTLDTLSKRDLLVGHKRVYSLSQLEQDVRSSGLHVLASRGFFLKVLPNSMMLGFSRELLLALNAISAEVPTELLANIVVVAAKAASI